MQVGGVGSGLDNHGSSHQVTGCMHEHNVTNREMGAMRSGVASQVTPAANAAAEAAKEGFSLVGTLRDVVSSGRRLWGKIWGGGAETGGKAGNGTEGSGLAVNGGVGENTAALSEQVMTQISEADAALQAGLAGYGTQQEAQAMEQNISMRHAPHVAAATAVVQSPQMTVQNNPYFTTTSDTGLVKQNFFQKIRVKFQEVTKHLTRRFAGTFSKQNAMDSRQSALSSKRQNTKEDMRKHSRYRDRDMEIDCVLTDDSYLMDSYDRKGEYSKLTTERKVRKEE